MAFYSFTCYILCSLSLYITGMPSISQTRDGIHGTLCCSGYVWNKQENSCIRDFSSLHNNIKLSTVSVPSLSTDYDEAAPKSANILNVDKICAEEKGDVHGNNVMSYIAGIISLQILAGLLLFLYVFTFSHRPMCIVQGDTASRTTTSMTV